MKGQIIISKKRGGFMLAKIETKLTMLLIIIICLGISSVAYADEAVENYQAPSQYQLDALMPSQ